MTQLRKTHLFYLKKVTQSDCRLPTYSRQIRDLAAKGFVRLSPPDELGDCIVKITPKGLAALEAASPRPYPAGS